MDRLRHDSPPLPRSLVGRVGALVSRLEQVFGAPAHAPDPGTRASAGLAHPIPGLQVLVVDDNPANLADACGLLQPWGITPMLAADGAEAVALARQRSFDLILMDLQMPVLDGLGATRQIRVFEHEQRSTRVPVLAYTSYALDNDVLRDCGVDGVLEKPCSAGELQDCLRRWCAYRSSADVDTDATVGAPSQR